MISNAVIEALKKYSPEGTIFPLEPMAAHTTFKVGGPCDCLIEICSEEQLIDVQNYLNKVEIPYFILGNGSNLLVSDDGYRGVILKLGNGFSNVEVNGNTVTALAGANLAKVARAAYNNSLTGFEFAAGIPGTVGGAMVMNAGAYGGEMKQVVKSVKMINQAGEILELDNESMEFGYRTSIIKKHPFTVLQVTFELTNGRAEDIKARMDELAAQRREKQPLEYPSAGSTFKRPEGNFAGKLIMEAGLRGFRIGDAAVSEKHCGFVVNMGNATACDVKTLIDKVSDKVYECSNVRLEPEVIFLGRF